jgi:hypothetical protein
VGFAEDAQQFACTDNFFKVCIIMCLTCLGEAANLASTPLSTGRMLPGDNFVVENRKTPMKISRLCLLVVLALLCTGLAFADGIKDPKIIIRGVQGGARSCPPGGCTNVGMNFSFTVPEKGHGVLFFTNASGKNWTSLKLIEKGVPAAAISCSQSLFLSCSIRTLEDGSVEILLAGVKGQNPRPGIGNGQSFSINLACVKKDCWPGGLQFTAHAGTSAPEPGTIALMVTGVGAILSRRKRWKSDLKA